MHFVNADSDWELVDMCFDFALIVDPQTGEIRRCNRAFRQWFETTSQRSLPHRLLDLLPQLSLNAELQRLSGSGHDQSTERELQLPLRVREDQQPSCKIRLRLLRKHASDNSSLPLLAVVIQNPFLSATSGRTQFATHDPVTRLPNREVLMNRLEELIRGERYADEDFTLLFIDLNDFKPINDRWGHMAGDEVLCEVARRLAGCIRQGDMLVRYGGDEFVALLEQASDESEYRPVMERLHQALDTAVATASGITASVSVSIGAIDSRHYNGTAREFLNAADQAMYRSKRQRAAALSHRQDS